MTNKSFGLRLRERRRGFVEHQHAGLDRERPRDLHQLLARDAQAAGARPHVADLRQSEVIPKAFRLADHPPAVQQSPESRLASEKDVLGDGQVGRQRQFLVDQPDPEPVRVGHIADVHTPSVVDNLAGVGTVDAAEDLDERGFAGAVLAEQRVDLAGPQLEVHAVERHDAAEALRHAAQSQ